MIKSSLQRCTILVVLFLGVGCAGIPEPETSGFLSDYSKLEEVAKDNLFYSSGELGQYHGFIIDPVKLLYMPDPDKSVFTPEDLQELQTFFEERLVLRLTEKDGYAIVSDPGPGIARLRFAITDVKHSIGILNISLFTKVTGAGLGGASAEGEIVDSLTNEQLAATIRWGGGSRVLMAGITKMGDAKIAINRWTKDLRKEFDKAHAQ